MSGEAGLIIVAVVATVILTVWAAQQGYEEYTYYMADRALIPMRAQLKERGFGDELLSALDEQGRATLGLHDGQITLLQTPAPATLRAHMAASKAPGTLSVGINYMMSPDLKRLQIVAEARLVPHSEAWRTALSNRNDFKGRCTRDDCNRNDALYRRIVYFDTRLPDGIAGRDAAADAWLANRGEPIRTAMREGLRLIALSLRDDLLRDPQQAMTNQKLSYGARMLDLLPDPKGVLHLHTRLEELLVPRTTAQKP
ncbi:hypothetical protein GCM10025770_20000 [Viridibacterium curvum]|uniref:Uncharacterized protein n=1 Tax=Viridibacterium curvum TaxID=1101404 RepID=A0ABP9QP07_9RHOO